MRMRRFVVFLSAVGFLYLLSWFYLANPLNFFVPHSKNFTLSRFGAIRPGASIADAIRILGDPVKVVKEGRFDPSCPTCVAYCFMGEPPDWVVGFKEAWIIADRQGKVVQLFVHTEP